MQKKKFNKMLKFYHKNKSNVKFSLKIRNAKQISPKYRCLVKKI